MLRKTCGALALALCALAPAWAASENFDLDPAHTYPSFEINHLGYSVMRGTFTSTNGSLNYDEEQRTGSVQATIDAASVFTGFAKRDEHLRSKDFFNVEKYPTLSFSSLSFRLESDKPVAVPGTLTMLGVTKPVSLQVQPTRCGARPDKKYVCGAIITSQIKRSDWGMNAFVPFVGDDVKIAIEVEAMKK
ncbi:MAG TPA: YceI family protein [Burkholderiaceae bacterium]|nr:YceI family protein [Burkholderiaceae bacterium]